MLSNRLSVSTRIWHLRSLIFLTASKHCGSSERPLFERLGHLAVDDQLVGFASAPATGLVVPNGERERRPHHLRRGAASLGNGRNGGPQPTEASAESMTPCMHRRA